MKPILIFLGLGALSLSIVHFRVKAVPKSQSHKESAREKPSINKAEKSPCECQSYRAEGARDAQSAPAPRFSRAYIPCKCRCEKRIEP
jgi:hypothetical protein